MLAIVGAAACAACGVRPAPDDTGNDGGQDSSPTLDTPDDLRMEAGMPDGTEETTPCDETLGIDVGPVEQFRQGTWTRLDSPPVIIGRDARGLWAYAAFCSHFGVPLPAPTNGFSVCPRNLGGHGSTFDGDGRLVPGSGPATMDLANYAVTVCNGRVYVNMSRRVPIGTRAPV